MTVAVPKGQQQQNSRTLIATQIKKNIKMKSENMENGR
jgi:hypothetical protein